MSASGPALFSCDQWQEISEKLNVIEFILKTIETWIKKYNVSYDEHMPHAMPFSQKVPRRKMQKRKRLKRAKRRKKRR